MADDPVIPEAPGSRRGHPVADAIGAVMKGARDGDKHVRKRAAGWLAMLGGGGLAVYIAVRAWGLAEEGIKRTWTVDDRQTRELVVAMNGLVAEIRADRAERNRDLDLIMDRLKIPRRPSPVAPAAASPKYQIDPFKDPSDPTYYQLVDPPKHKR